MAHRASQSIAVIMIGALLAYPGVAVENMIGRQSQNEGLYVVPAPGRVTIDGKLDDWDFSGRIWSFADQLIRNRYSAETAAMWDREALYIAVKWRDPTPMHSVVDPVINPENGWMSDSLQMRVSTADQTSWLTTWYFTPRRQPVVHRAVWKDRANSRQGMEILLLVAPEGGTELGEGAEMAYLPSEDGAGFIQELRLPWALLFKQPPEIAAGVVFQLGFEFLWGDPTGGLVWPIHRYADNLQPGTTTREFFWEAYRTWGNATLLASGGLPLRRYVSDERRIEGTIPLRFDVPKNAARLTLVIEDELGNRVRNLAGDLTPDQYAVAESGDRLTVEVNWDGLDDEGRLVKPGAYRARGLHHGGLGAEYELCFYNPGTPPWRTACGAGAWGADHSKPSQVASAGDWIIVAWGFAEGGSGIIGVAPDGRKRWGEKRAAKLLAGDDTYVYAVPAGWNIREEALIRLDKTTGAYRAFQRDGVELPFEYPLASILGADGYISTALTATDDELLILLRRSTTDETEPTDEVSWIARIDKRTAGLKAPPIQTVRLDTLTSSPDGQAFARQGAQIFRVDIESGAVAPIATPGLVHPGAMTVDANGNVLVFDAGPDQQIKAFAADGSGLRYTCGVKGGRPLRGVFNPQAVQSVSSVAVDALGRVWATEKTDTPRRVSVWRATDGALDRDYIGNTSYGGTGCYLHDTDPNLAYVGPVEIKLDRANRTWSVSRILWVPDPAVEGERFPIDVGSHTHPQRFSATVQGRSREYLFVPGYRNFMGYTIFMEADDGWRPVSAITTVSQISGDIDHMGNVLEAPSGEFAKYHPYDAVFWNDTNRDGRVQRSECVIVQPETARNAHTERTIPIPMGGGWGSRLAADFTFYVNGLAAYRPIGFSEEGAPIYGLASLRRFDVVEPYGDFVPVIEEDLVLALGWHTQRMAGIDTRDGGRVRWSYPNRYPSVHGSHRAPMATPGLLIGPLKIVGVALVNETVGRVFMLRGNLGQDYLMTTDGLFVGAMFQDGRLPSEWLPATEEALVGMPMEMFSHGGEPFNGWFGKQADGIIRTLAGLPREAAMLLTLNGLDTIQRFDAGIVAVTDEILAEADLANVQRVEQSAPPKDYTVRRMAVAPRIDGHTVDWEGIPALRIDRVGFPLGATALMSWDDEHLYLAWTVQDPSPWLNEGKDHTALFKTGDAVDIQLCTDPAAAADVKRREPGAGDLRVVISQWNRQPVAVLMRPIDPAAPPSLAVEYVSPVGSKRFDRVEVLSGARVAVVKGGGVYTIEVSLPLTALGLKPEPGLALRGDIGFISSDAAGMVNAARTYWSNKDTNLVNDLPHEAWLYPSTWGALRFE